MTTDAPRDAMQGVVDDETNTPTRHGNEGGEERHGKSFAANLRRRERPWSGSAGPAAERGLRNARANVDAVAADASDRISAAADAAASSISETL